MQKEKKFTRIEASVSSGSEKRKKQTQFFNVDRIWVTIFSSFLRKIRADSTQAEYYFSCCCISMFFLDKREEDLASLLLPLIFQTGVIRQCYYTKQKSEEKTPFKTPTLWTILRANFALSWKGANLCSECFTDYHQFQKYSSLGQTMDSWKMSS